MNIPTKIRLCILGKPGSGKGTISKALTEALPHSCIHYYNVGSILRERASQGDQHIKQVHATGGLVNSDKVLDIIQEALQCESFILDGSPRRPEEASFIINSTEWINSPGFLIHLDIKDSLAKERLLSRGRFDDNPNVIDNRLDGFNSITTESIKVFGNRCIVINANQPPKKVVQEILSEIAKRL